MGNLGIGMTSPGYALDVNGDMRTNGTLYLGNETTDIDNRYDINTFMKPLTRFLTEGGAISNLTYTTDVSSPVGTEIVQTSSYMWVNGPLIRLDRTKNYEVEMWIRRTVAGTTASVYMVVANFDSNKVIRFSNFLILIFLVAVSIIFLDPSTPIIDISGNSKHILIKYFAGPQPKSTIVPDVMLQYSLYQFMNASSE
jgi:hypothetical protein